MPGAGRGLRGCAAEPGGEVGGSETVAGGGGIGNARNRRGLHDLIAAFAEDAGGRAIQSQHDLGRFPVAEQLGFAGV